MAFSFFTRIRNWFRSPVRRVTVSEVVFTNTNRAKVATPLEGSDTDDIVHALDLPAYQSILVSIGGANTLDANLAPKLTQLFGRGLVRAAVDVNAVLIDGGTEAGVMELLGKQVGSNIPPVSLIGVAPLAKIAMPGDVSGDVAGDVVGDAAGDAHGRAAGAGDRAALDPNHSHFVLTDGAGWGSETLTLFNLAETLATRKQGGILVVLTGGGKVARTEVLQAVKRKIPIVVISGSGGTADEIAAAWKTKDAQPPADAVMAEICAGGQITFFPVEGLPEDLKADLSAKLTVDLVLMDAWERFADFDLNANREQRSAGRLQGAIIFIGVFGTALTIVKQVWNPPGPDESQDWAWVGVYQVLIIIPIVLGILALAVNRFKQAKKWLLLRAAAEAIKREIYRYRTSATYYRPDPTPAANGQPKPSPQQQLSSKMDDITRRTFTTDVNSSALRRYDKTRGFPPYMYAAKGGDDGFSPLLPDKYIRVRLGDQLNYFNRRTIKLERQLNFWAWTGFVIGGLGTFLAANKLSVWIALTTALTTAIATYLAYRQTEMTLVKYNQTATNLANIQTWWWALSAAEKAMPDNIDALVEHTERVLQDEMEGWVQQMQNALEQLYNKGAAANSQQGKGGASTK
jgi:SLOG in TRPM, prokaryote/SMODS and SLOG-associating 2TM effector domain 1/Protein of unknown function (DUF4231)